MAEERSQVTTGSPVTGGQTSLAQDEITTSLLNRNSLQLTNLSRTVTNLSGQMTVLSNSLQSVGRNLATTQSLERQKEQQEQSLENKLAQQQLREGKESVIEKKIQASAIAPAQKLSGQAQFTLGRLQSFFVTLLGGWLVDKGIDTINALASGNREELEKIKVQTLTGLGVITGIFVAAKLVIAKMIASFSLLGIGLTGLAIAGLFTTPGQQLLQFLVDSGANALKGTQDWWNNTFGGGNKSPNENLNLPDDDDTDSVKRPDVNIDDISDNEAPPMKEGGLVMGKSHSEGGENKNLEGGEYVIRKPAVEAFGTELMDTINSIDARGAQQALMDQFGLVDRVNEVGADQALQEFRIFKMSQQLNMLAPYADIERQITENGERVTKSVSAMIQNGEIVKQKPDVSSGDVELPENLQTISADYTNDRTNTDVDRSLDATLAREDALLNLALEKNNEAKISPVPKKETSVSDVISQSTDTSAPIIIMSNDSKSSAPPQQVPVSQGSVGGVPSFPSKNNSDMYILTTLSLLNVVV